MSEIYIASQMYTCELVKVEWKKVIAPHHLFTFPYESGLSKKFLTHRTLPMKNCTIEAMAKYVFEVLSGYDSWESIKPVLADNTSVNTRWKNGWLNFKIGRKIRTKLAHCQMCYILKQAITRSMFKKTTEPQNFNEPLRKQFKTNSTTTEPRNLNLLKLLRKKF